jgi:hypothetical protein
VFFLEDALHDLGASVLFARDERTLGCWGLIVNGKTMVYLIDNRHPHEAAKEDPAAKELLARGALVCHAQKRDAERVGGKWLPLAVSPGYSFKPATAQWDVAFVGMIRDAQRAVILTDVASRYSLCVGENVFGENAVQMYREARAGLNIPTGYGTPQCYDINMRVLEILATGTPLVTNWLPELAALGLVDGETCVTYRKPQDILTAIELAKLRPEIGFKGKRLAEEKHTYRHRAEQVLQWLQ